MTRHGTGTGDERDAGARLEDLLGRQGGLRDEADAEAGAGDTADRPATPPGKPATSEPVSEAPLFALLTTIERDLTVERIERIWIFPPRRFEAGETAVVVVAAYPALDPERRTVYAAHYTVSEQAAEPRLALQEFGTAPAERVARIVEDVVGRIKDEAPVAPAATRIEGQLARWHQMRHDLAERHLDQTTRHPRLRGSRLDTRDPS